MDILICYKSQRRPAARHLASVLAGYGYDVAFDYQDIPADGFNRHLEERIAAAKAVPVLWCGQSVSSQWVIEQARLAKDAGRLVPVLMESAELPLGFAGLNTHDLSDWDGSGRSALLDGFIEELARLTGKRPQMDYDKLKAYEDTWRDFGALRFSQFSHSAAAPGDTPIETARAASGKPESTKPEGDNDVFKVFDEMFGAGSKGGGAAAAESADIHTVAEITLEEAFSGIEKDLEVSRTRLCSACSGQGILGTGPDCSACSGTGKVTAKQGMFQLQKTCTNCQGAGKTVVNKCDTCSGIGTSAPEIRHLRVKIPAGSTTGTRIRLAGEGGATPARLLENGSIVSAQTGDLYIQVHLKSHPYFETRGADVYCNAIAKPSVLKKGGKLMVHDVSGAKIKLNVPQGVEAGKSMRLEGRGMPHLKGGGRGDLYVRLVTQS